MKKTLNLAVMLLLFTSSYSQELRSFQVNNLFGFKDGDKVVIAPKYQYASEFYGSLALVKTNNLWGYIDKNDQWIIKPQFDQAELMLNGKARVYQKGKVGLIDSLGDLIIPVEFDRIEDSYYGYNLYKGDRKGLLSDRGDFVDAKYDEVSRYSNFTIARFGNLYDIYFENKLLFQRSERMPELKYYSWLHFIDVYQNGMGALMDNQGKMMTEFIYRDIKTFETPSYPSTIETVDYTFMIYLDRTIQNLHSSDDPDLVVFDPAFDIVKADGVWLSDQPFDQVFQPDPYGSNESPIVALKQNGFMVNLDEVGNIIVSPYTEIVNYMGFTIKYMEGKKAEIYSYTEPSRLLRTFNYVDFRTHEEVMMDYETGETWTQVLLSSYGELIVSNDPDAKENSGKKALYSITMNQLMTEEMDTLPEIFSANFEGTIGYYILWHFGRFNYWYSGAEPVKNFPYTNIVALGNTALELTDVNGKQFVLNVESDKLIETTGYLAQYSTNIYSKEYLIDDSNPEYNPEYGTEYYYRDPYPIYSTRFILLSDTSAGKFGLIHDNFQIKPKYDSIVQLSENGDEQILNLKSGELWGVFFLRTHDLIEPQFEAPALVRTWDVEQGQNFQYVDFSETKQYYIDSKGRTWKNSPMDVYPFTEKGKYGLETYNSFSQDEDRIVILKPEFRKLMETDAAYTFIAQNKKKKWGIVNAYGDTLLPFEYNNYSYVDYNSFDGTTYLEIKKGKKVGYYNQKTSKIIPALYEDIEPFYFNIDDYGSYISTFMVHANGKVGWYDVDFNIILPCIYDGITIANRPEGGMEIAILKDDKMAIFFTDHLPQNMEEKLANARWYDRVADRRGYIIENETCKAYNLETGDFITESSEPDAFSVMDEMYIVKFKDGLIGLNDIEDWEIMKPSVKWLIFQYSENHFAFKNGYTYLQTVGMNDMHLRYNW